MSKRMKSLGISLLSWALILNISVGSTLLSVNDARAERAARTNAAQLEMNAFHKEMGELLIDPTVSQIENGPRVEGFDLHLSPRDSLVDADPFFFASQSWTAANAPLEDESVGFIEHQNEILIQPRNQTKAWQLRAPLRPVLATDEYIYLAARDASLFASKGNGQGLFVVPYQKLLGASVTGARVPVFFMPLPGFGWAGSVVATEVPHRGFILVRNASGFELPVNVADVRQVVKIESVNLLFAVHQAMQKAHATLKRNKAEGIRLSREMLKMFGDIAKEANGNAGAPSGALMKSFSAYNQEVTSTVERLLGTSELTLPRGSTAGFGTLYTGFDLEHPENGSVVFGKTDTRTGWFQKVLDAIGVRKAYAVDPETAKFIAYTTRVLAVCGTVFIASVIARYTVLKKEVQRRIDEGQANGDNGVAKRVNWDIFAHSLTVLAQAPSVWSAQALRYSLDRIGVGENNIVRKLYDATFGFSLKTNDKTPVNSKTLVQGVAVLGGVDTALVAIQGYFLVQWMADLLAWGFPELAPRVNAAYHSGDAAVSLYLMLSVVQNAVAWLSSGAYNFAHDVQTNKQTEGERVVSSVMRSEGKDPAASEHKTEYDQRVKDFVRDAMQRQGLPSEKDFLFDANTLYSKVIAFFGYVAPLAQANGQDTGDDKAREQMTSYKGLERPGSMYRALKIAITNAEAAAKADVASLEKAEALKVLKQVRADMSILHGFLEHPGWYFSPTGLLKVAKLFRKVRMDLTSLTFEGPIDAPIHNVPESWSRTSSPGAATLAAEGFRAAFFGLSEFAPKANPIYGKVSNTLKAPFRFLDRTFENWQIHRAVTRATEAFIKQTGTNPDEVKVEERSENSSEHKKLWDALLQKELVRVAGIFPDYKEGEFFAQVEEAANEKLSKRLSSDQEFQEELAKLSPEERSQRIALQKADSFAEAYVALAGKKDSPTEAVLPLQPGVFQRIRQTQVVRNSAVLTKSLRAAEGLMSNSRYQRGLWPQLARVVPLLDDMTQGNLVTLRNFPIAATVAYGWTWLVWGTTFPRMIWFINTLLLGSTIRGPWMTTLRITSNLGIQPGATTWGMIKYGVIGSFATMWGFFFFPMYKDDMVKAVTAVGAFCSRMLLGN